VLGRWFEVYAARPWIEQKSKTVKDDASCTGYSEIILKEIPHPRTFLAVRYTLEAAKQFVFEVQPMWSEPLQIEMVKNATICHF
jgi:hypothetical protein